MINEKIKIQNEMKSPRYNNRNEGIAFGFSKKRRSD